MINGQTAVKIEGIMAGLMKQLAQLAPHPDRPDYRGPLFVFIDTHLKPAAEYDGMLGSMMMENMLGLAFSSASVQGVSGFDAAECISEYFQDRPANNNSMALHFNGRAHSKLMQAYLHDLPRRMGLERWLAYYQRKLYAMKKHPSLVVPSLAA